MIMCDLKFDLMKLSVCFVISKCGWSVVMRFDLEHLIVQYASLFSEQSV